jgi:hypothetical protein
MTLRDASVAPTEVLAAKCESVAIDARTRDDEMTLRRDQLST